MRVRRGEVVEVEEREVDVHAFELRSAADLLDAGEPILRLHVECGSGTYVRSLVRDLGERLGCGAHVAELRRLWVDPFREPKMWTLDDLQALAERGERSLDACLLPIERGMDSWSPLAVTPAQAARLAQGQWVQGVEAVPGAVALFDANGRALGLGEVDAGGILRPRRLFAWACAGAAAATAG